MNSKSKLKNICKLSFMIVILVFTFVLSGCSIDSNIITDSDLNESNLSDLPENMSDDFVNDSIIEQNNETQETPMHNITEDSFREYQNIEEIVIDCSIREEDRCFVSLDSENGWVVGSLGVEFIIEILEDNNLNITLEENPFIKIIKGEFNEKKIKEESIKQISEKVLDFSNRLKKLARENIDQKDYAFEYLRPVKINDKWMWQFSVSSSGDNFPEGNEKVLIAFDLRS